MAPGRAEARPGNDQLVLTAALNERQLRLGLRRQPTRLEPTYSHCHGIVTTSSAVSSDHEEVLDDETVALALAANPIIRGFTFIRWFNGTLALDHLEAVTGQDRVDLERGLLEWTLARGGGYEIVAYNPKAIALRRGVVTERPTLEVWLPYSAWQRFR